MVPSKVEKDPGTAFGAPLVIWSHSFCRSTLATYLELQKQYPGKVHIVVHGKSDPDFRAKFGFKSSEFDISKLQMIDPAIDEAFAFLDAHSNSIHMFTAYHKSKYSGSQFFNKLISRAIEKNMTFLIGSEAPQNMETKGFKYFAKELYLRFGLKLQLSQTIKSAQFMLSYSGSGTALLTRMGWPAAKLEPFGYYPPPLQNAYDAGQDASVNRSESAEVLTLLLSGDHSMYKSPITAIEAAEHLCMRGYGKRFRFLVAGKGQQTNEMRRRAAASNLPVEFMGFVELSQLIALHRVTDVFLATGISEPWGIRVNDALNLGCPAIVSMGMGAVDLVHNTGCGWTYEAGNSDALAKTIIDLIDNPEKVERARSQVLEPDLLSSSYQAGRIVEIMRNRFS